MLSELSSPYPACSAVPVSSSARARAAPRDQAQRPPNNRSCIAAPPLPCSLKPFERSNHKIERELLPPRAQWRRRSHRAECQRACLLAPCVALPLRAAKSTFRGRRRVNTTQPKGGPPASEGLAVGHRATAQRTASGERAAGGLHQGKTAALVGWCTSTGSRPPPHAYSVPISRPQPLPHALQSLCLPWLKTTSMQHALLAM